MFRKLTYEEIFKCATEYARLSKLEREIIEFLDSRENKDFAGTYTALTLAMGRPKSHNSNVRKAVVRLEEKNLVWEFYDEASRKDVIFLAADWLAILVYGEAPHRLALPLAY